MLPFPSNTTCDVAANEAQDFGKYKLVSKLAAGGMAITYRALMQGAAGVTKPVVIKQILPHFADDPEFVKMFVDEARLVTRLNHGNIAQVYDFGQLEGQYYLAMEFVHGQPLSKVLRRAQRAGLPGLPTQLALHIATQMCEGLDFAHRHLDEEGRPLGLVHRDVSPDNVLISYEGEVKIIDFGIAKATSAVEARTSPGTLKGKYPYFSTEQARGQLDLDARSDIFAAGVVLYEMLCGRRPYEGEMVTVLPRIIAADYALPSALNPAISHQLESVILTAMALDREARYPTALNFGEALRELLYSENPRFSPTLLSQLMGHLFAEELAAEGRRLEVTPAFMEMLASWQAQVAGEPTGPKVKPVTSGSGRPALRTSNPGVRSAAGRTSSTPSMRRVTSGTGVPRLASSPGPRSEARRGTSERPVLPTMVAPPELDLPEPSTAVTHHPAEVDERHDTPVELPAVTAPPAVSDAMSALRAAHLREQQERAERRQRLVMLISVPLFGLALLLGLLHYLLSDKNEGHTQGTLWLTSKPAGATVKLNGKDVAGVTPLVVGGVILHEANTLALTLPGYRPWTKRFTPTSESSPPMHAELERLTPEPTPAEPPPAPTTTVSPAAQAPGEQAPGQVVEASASAEADPRSKHPRDFYEVDYPARLFTLRPMYNAFPLDQYATSSIELNPGSSYSVSTDGSAVLQPGRGGATGTLAYFIEGDNLQADDTFGLLGRSPRTIKGARRLHVFLLDDDVEDNRGTVRVHLRQSKWVAPKQLTFEAAEDALVLKPEHHLVLRGLNPKAIYLLTVRDDFPELRPGANGRVSQVLCAESSAKSARRNHRLLVAGKRYQLTGADTLRCTYPDIRVEDNAGALAVDIVDVTAMSRRERAAALRGASR